MVNRENKSEIIFPIVTRLSGQKFRIAKIIREKTNEIILLYKFLEFLTEF